MRGLLEVIAGPMFSGKTTELIRRASISIIAGQRPVVYKPYIDNRYSVADICSHFGTKMGSLVVMNANDILKSVRERRAEIGKVYVDEAQFFGMNLIGVVGVITDELGIGVVVAGLNLDFRAEPFGPMAGLLARANEVSLLTAVCTHRDNDRVCGEPAHFSQRLINGSPARYTDPVVMVGAKEVYEARCFRHFEIPEKPYFDMTSIELRMGDMVQC